MHSWITLVIPNYFSEANLFRDLTRVMVSVNSKYSLLNTGEMLSRMYSGSA